MSDSELIPCPYNMSHMILKSRMASHLIKCRKQHCIGIFETCPFNSTHDMPFIEYEYHIQICPDRKQVEHLMYVVDEPPKEKPQVDVNVSVPYASENWDEEECAGGSYLNVKDKKLEKELVFRQPIGLSKADRKAFFKNEAFRFGKAEDSSEEPLENKPSGKTWHWHSLDFEPKIKQEKP